MESQSQSQSQSQSLLLEDFGQKVDLTRRIREVLLNYPEGTTVLKELIQNADDAGATAVKLCLDRRNHNTESLLSSKLAQWQGPALLAYNNGVFTEEDFASISRIGGSGKQGQAWKTGRFGVGFNSVYHLTDLPSFVSDKYVVLFDPQGDYLPNVSTLNPGKRIEYVTSSAITKYRDQLSPYRAFGCNMETSFPGTIFRFPLRNKEQAESSKLSKQAYLADDISSMFSQLFEEGVFTLLFLKSVISIEMYVWDTEMPEPRKTYSCSIGSANNDTVWHRQTLLRLSKNMNSSDNKTDGFLLDFLSEDVTRAESQKRVDSFYIVQTMASASSKIGSFAASMSKDYDIHLLPWGAVAACISDNSSRGDVLKDGRAFCFLPLPVKTGMNVQVNGYFEVSSNRRGIWYGADMDRSGRIRSLWNKLLLEDVVASSFVNLLLQVQPILGPTNSYYSLWPTGSFEEPWNILVEQIYKNIGNSPVFHSDLDGGKWVPLAEAFLHDNEFSKRSDLGKALVQLGLPIVHLPIELRDMIIKSASSVQLKVVTPDSVRNFLRKSKGFNSISRSYILVLLEYCLEDLIDDDVVTHAYDLPLVPLANGEFGSFSEASKGVSYFVCNDLEYELLEKIPDRVIAQNLPPNILTRLASIAMIPSTNIFVFDVHVLLQLFPKIVPADWKYKTSVFWDPESNSNHPGLTWFHLFWKYVRGNCDSLSIFSDWPIMPSLSGHLYKPSRQLKLLNVDKLSDKMQDLLGKTRCKILNTSHGVDHPDMVNYVRDADGAGVLKSIFDVASSNDDIKEIFLRTLDASERDELHHFFLDPRWYIGNNMSESDKKTCMRLPIFQVYGGEESYQYSELEDRMFLPPYDIPVSLVSGDFVKTSSGTEDEILCKYYGIERMRKARFYKQYVFNKVKELPSEFRDIIMMSVLRELPHLSAEDPTFRGQVAILEFVPTTSGSLKSPAVLYDPRNEELYALLEDSDSFPAGVFEESTVLDILQGLGLKTFVSPEAVLQSARQVERLVQNDQQKAHYRGKVLLSYMEVNALKWLPDIPNDQGTVNRMFSPAATAFRSRNIKSDLEKFWNDLRLISWCPVLVSSPFQSLPWPNVSSTVAPPKLVRLYSDLWLVSASMRILDGNCSSSSLSHYLGWSSPPGGSVIAAQLLELGKNNETVTDSELRHELALAMPRIYSILLNMLNSDEMDIVKAVLESSRWIWVGDGFATPEEVVINGSLHLAPYIRVIPVDLAVFRALFLELGIREFLKPTDYAKILCRMARIKGSTPLNPQELRAALLIAQHLAEVQLYEEQVKIFLPDVSCLLVDATDLVYNDAPWLLGSETPDNPFGNASNVAFNMKRTVHKFVHGNISNDVAEKLGVHSLRRMLLAESADSMNLSLSGAAEAFGQHEALTTRLKHILEMYADGPGTLFELVQNAEDAKATEVAFLLDNTNYGTSSVLSPEMADWQGPALYCFNNSVFSPQDLYAISRIGQESKLDKPFAIGRFGLGFNCVYHFTDIPTFVSGENIVLFDPHACNLPGISPSHPGLRIKFAGRKILEQFPDQFSPFLHFGCDMHQSFPGTLFRFPLRNGKAASKSQIKKEAYSPDDVMSLLSSFAGVIAQTLLFLRNVETIAIYTKEGVGSEMQLVHRVHKQRIGELETDAEKNTFQLMVNYMHENRDGSDKNYFFDRLRRSNDTLPWKSQKLMLTEKSSSEEKSNIWLTSECIDGRRGKRNSESKESKSNKFIPWACVASCLNTEVKNSFEGQAFCFLPLPITTGLPVHVNAYFELSSNRRDIWFGNDMAGGGKKRSEWNVYLLEEVAAPAYGHLLEKLTTEIDNSDSFYSFWPTTATSGPWASMVQKLYNFVADSGLRVLFTKARGGQWISTKQAIFPDFTFENAHGLIDALSDAGLPITTIPKPHVEKFTEFCPSLHFLTPQLLRTLLGRRRREFRDRNGVILALEYCLLDLKTPIQSDSFYGLPLLPLSNGLFSVFEKRGLSDRVFVARGDAYNLLKDSVSNQLVDSEISDAIYGKLCEIAESESFNISFLNCHLLEKLFLRLLPGEWMHAKQVTWIPGQQVQPTLEWMRLLWNYLNSNCDDLSVFSKWPILPVGNNHLFQLVENSNVIEDDGWSENMSSLLLKIGCLLLRHDFELEHPHLNKYVQSPTASGVLNALSAIAREPEKVERLFIYASEGELHELRSFILQSKWFSEGLLNESHISIIKQIPMFESFKSRKLVSLTKPAKWLKPDGILEDLLDDDFLRIDSEKERKLLKKYLHIKEPSRVQFYKGYVFNRMPELVSQQGILSAILGEIRVLIKEDSSFKKELMMTPFVLTKGGSLQEPQRLYDPRVTELHKFLHKESFFPSENFSDLETLETLVALGLRQTLGTKGLLDSARSVSMWHDAKEPEAVVNGKRLLGCLDALALNLSTEEVEFSFNEFGDTRNNKADNLLDELPGEEFWSELKSISWCPVYVDSPVQGLPWLLPPQEIAAPDTVRPNSQMWLASSMMHILDGECNSMFLQRMLGWTDRLHVNILCTQLVGLSKSYTQLKMNSELDPEFEGSLQEHMPVLYSNLQEYVGTDEFELLKASLRGVSWVWIGDDFVTVEALAFDSPVKYSPYLYVVPSELSVFRDLLLALGVRLSFDVFDYANVLLRLQNDVKGSPLSEDQLSFVLCVLEAVSDCQLDRVMFESSNSPLLFPDSRGYLMSARDVMYNDTPWMDNNVPLGKHIIHSSISHDLANRLGIQSLRSISLVSEEMTKDLPCMDYAKICDLLELYGSEDFLLFDLIELADCCKARKLHIIFDKREHPCQSLLQQNLGEFQGPALVAVLEGASLSREEISSLQFLPPWGLRGDMLNYGLGLMSCYSVTDLPSVISGGYLYMFDPRGMAFAPPSSNHSPAAKMFTLAGTNLTERFRDQFSPMFVGQKVPWSNDSTVIRMPFSSKFIEDGTESEWTEIRQIFDRFMKHASRTLVFLKSVSEVSLSTWEEKDPQPSQDFLIYVDSSHVTLRNPFSEKKWKKFQISNLFGTSSSAVKLHVVDINLHQNGTIFLDRWLVVLSLGSGQTRNMALDRRYLAYNLTPVAGVAVHILRNGHLAEARYVGSIMSPLPLSDCVSMPVAVLGCFLVRHNRGRFIFMYQDSESLSRAQPDAGNQLIEVWNRELMSCVRDSYIRLVLEMFKIRRDPSTSTLEARATYPINLALNACGSQIYSFWPTSSGKLVLSDAEDDHDLALERTLKADWNCLVDQVIEPFYSRLVDLPVWQLYSGSIVKAEEGMFLSQPGSRINGNVLPATVCDFVKEHYPVFSVPWELVLEIQSIGFNIREIIPKMVRDLLRMSPIPVAIPSIDTYVDVLEYCLSDIQLLESSIPDEPSTSGADWPPRSAFTPPGQGDHPIELVANIGKALFDFGRGVVEDMGRGGGSLTERHSVTYPGFDRNVDRKLLKVASELKGLPCPTATSRLTKIGLTELWVGNQQEQSLMSPLAAMFVHPNILERPILEHIFTSESLLSLLNLHIFSPRLLADHMSSLFHENWVNHVMNSSPAPWFSWENNASSSREGGASPEWTRLFWKCFSESQDLPLFNDWPIVPAFLGRPVLCRVKHCNLIFIPPILTDSDSETAVTEWGFGDDDLTGMDSLSEEVRPHMLAFKVTGKKYPWLYSLLNQCNIPVLDSTFMDCAPPLNYFPDISQSLGKTIATKLLAAKNAGYLPKMTSFLASDSDELFSLLAYDFSSDSSDYTREDLEVLRELPIYKTVTGTYKKLNIQEMCIITSNSFLKPYNEQCLYYGSDSVGSQLVKALGISELGDKQLFVKFSLPGFEEKTQSEQEDILIYLYTNWHDLQQDSLVIEALKETKFVKSADQQSEIFHKPKDLFDPGDSLLTSVFSGEVHKFPGERFVLDGWLNILRKTGLQNTSNADVVLECARRVEFLGAESMKPKPSGFVDDFDDDFSNSTSEVSLEIWSLAASLMTAIFGNFAVLYGNNFCNILGKIACVPAEKGFPSVNGKKGDKRVLCSYSESILLKDWPLAWSVAPILSRQSMVPPEYAWGAFQLRTPPLFTIVLKHLQAIGKNFGEDTLAHWPNELGLISVEEASFEIFKYLEKNWGALSSSDVSELQQVAFIPAANGTRLVTSRSLFARLTVNLSPFAFELPSRYLPFVKILKELGLQDTLSISCAMDLLSNLQKSCGYQRLNPNELRAVMEILHFLCNEAIESNWVSDLIVPDDGCRLVHANSCVYIDSYGSRYVKYIDSSRLRFVHQDVSERLCLAFHIRKLSDVVVEELDGVEQLQTLEEIGSVSLTTIRQKLLSSSFQAAVSSVLNTVPITTSKSKISDLPTLQKSLESIAQRLQFVQSIYTRFWLLPKSLDITRASKDSIIPEWKSGPTHRALYYVDRSKTRMLIAEPPSYVSVLDLVSIVMSHVLGSRVPLPIGSLFLCPEDSETALINILQLSSNERLTDDMGSGNSFLGRDILPQDAMQVQLHPLRPFYKGERVAWKSQNGQKLKYGKIPEDVRPSAGQALYRFNLEMLPGKIEAILSSHVFSFKSLSTGNESSSKVAQDSDNIVERIRVDQPEGSERVKSKNQKQPVKELQHGRVSAEELVQAVQEMLSAAGIRMDTEKQSLLQTTLSLQERLKESQATLLLEQEKSEMATKEADTAKAAWLCRICLTNEVDITIVPCGHVLCRRCSSAVSRCPFCRLQVSSTIKIYRP